MVADQWLWDYEIDERIHTKTAAQPPYNFMFLDACLTGASPALATSFHIDGTLDRAFVGWTLYVAQQQQEQDWTVRLFQNLLAGLPLQEAIDTANAGGHVRGSAS